MIFSIKTITNDYILITNYDTFNNKLRYFLITNYDIKFPKNFLGVWHQQSRYDRDSYITIDYSNVDPTKANNFDKEDDVSTTNYNVPYDYGSVMHYGESYFALDKSKPNIYAIEPNQQATMGNRIAPSFNDLLLINTHYSCLGRKIGEEKNKKRFDFLKV